MIKAKHVFLLSALFVAINLILKIDIFDEIIHSFFSYGTMRLFYTTTLFFFIPLAFSFLLLFLPPAYFHAWFRFAWWGSLIALGTNTYYELYPSRGFMSWNYDILVIFGVYGLFVFGSLVQLARVFFKRRRAHRLAEEGRVGNIKVNNN